MKYRSGMHLVRAGEKAWKREVRRAKHRISSRKGMHPSPLCSEKEAAELLKKLKERGEL